MTREDAIYWIKNLAVLSTEKDMPQIEEALNMAIEALEQTEPEIIRCRDCKYYQTKWETSFHNRHYCATMDSMMPADGFCCYAERRTDERSN